VGGVANIGLLFGLVPGYGMYGAFIAKTAATVLQCAIKFRFMRRMIGPLWSARELIRLALVLATVAALVPLFLGSHLLLKILGILLVGLIIVPVMMLALGLLHPLRLLRFYWRNQYAADVDSVVNLLDTVVADLRRHTQEKRHYASHGNARRFGVDRGTIAIMLHRMARFFLLRDKHAAAAALQQLGVLVSSVNIERSSHLGPGCVLLNPEKMQISAHAGKNLTCVGSVQLGSAGIIHIGDNVTMEPGTRVAGPAQIPSNSVTTATSAN
jgi:serine acetyltransferase